MFVFTNYKPGDYVRYEYQNEIGKIKRLRNDGRGAFIWFHTGDTAASSDFRIIKPVLLASQASNMTKEELLNKLQSQDFSNNYAIGSLIDKQPISEDNKSD